MPKQKVSEVNKKEAEARKAKIVERMQALEDLEKELGCVFVPLIQYSQHGSQTYIAPMDAPSEEKKDVV